MLDKFSKTTYIIGGLVGLLLAYLLGSLAFDSGSWWHYLGTLILLIISIRLIIKAIKNKG